MILVVSPDVEITEAILGVLGGVTAVACKTAQEALALLPGASGIVLDLLSPGIDGRELKRAEVPILIIGAFKGRPILIVDRIMMPFTLERLQTAVSEVTIPGSVAADTCNTSTRNAA